MHHLAQCQCNTCTEKTRDDHFIVNGLGEFVSNFAINSSELGGNVEGK